MKSIQKTLTKIPRTGINTVVVNSLPNGVPALVSKNPDETYTIALNNMYAHERLKREFLHELKHIVESHHDLPTADEAENAVRNTQAVKPQQSQNNKPGYLFYEAISWLGYYLELKAYLEQNAKYEKYLAAKKAKEEVEKMIRKAERIDRLKRKLEIDEYDPFEGYDFEAQRRKLGLI